MLCGGRGAAHLSRGIHYARNKRRIDFEGAVNRSERKKAPNTAERSVNIRESLCR